MLVDGGVGEDLVAAGLRRNSAWITLRLADHPIILLPPGLPGSVQIGIERSARAPRHATVAGRYGIGLAPRGPRGPPDPGPRNRPVAIRGAESGPLATAVPVLRQSFVAQSESSKNQ